MISEETEKELKELLKEVNITIKQIEDYILSNKELSEDLIFQIDRQHNLKITNKIEKITKKIEKEQDYDKK